MDNIKGNAALNIGYSCKQRELVNQYTRTPPCKIRTSHVFSVCVLQGRLSTGQGLASDLE